uniref:Peptidase M24 domain-containing protein n=1 Tax=Ditylenchus dipsaci TaxID=166011 RepID=A0A915D0I4_9BILA
MLTDLKEAGILQGNVEEMLQANLGGFFMPHGLGHYIRLDVHDVYGLKSLVSTVVFLKSYASDKALGTSELNKFIVESKLNEYRGIGGVRIEDVVVIWEGGNENISHDVPRTVDEIESYMGSGFYKNYELNSSYFKWWYPSRWFTSRAKKCG